MNFVERLWWRIKYRGKIWYERPRCLNCQTPLLEYGELCSKCNQEFHGFMVGVQDSHFPLF